MAPRESAGQWDRRSGASPARSRTGRGRIHPRSGRKPLLPFLAVGAMALALVYLGVLEYQWSDTVSEASLAQIRSNLHSALLAMQDDFRRQVLGLAENLETARKERPWPSLVAKAYVLPEVADGRMTLFERDRISAPPRMVNPPANLERLIRVLGGEAGAGSSPAMWMAGETPVLVAGLPAATGFSRLILELNPEILRREILPAIVRRHVKTGNGGGYDIAIVRAHHPEDQIYVSDCCLAADFFRTASDRVKLAGFRDADVPDGAGDSWEIVARHRRGSVAEAVETMRIRLLSVSFAVLLVLALGLVMIAVYALRSQELLRLQMEFVASVSHELRTPISVIGSAADNLADGVVRSETTVRDYGALIRDQSRRLSGVVEQTLRFAAGKADYRPRHFQLLRVPELIERVLAESSALLAARQFTVEKVFEPGLPLVRVDERLFSECLQNLIGNAVKYDAGRRWMRIRAVPVETGRGAGARITVEDCGIGISPEDLPHIFEPFFRGREARSEQIQGTGLGLCLAQEAASSFGARITVESTPGEGSTFAIHLPAVYMNSSTVPVEAIVES